MGPGLRLLLQFGAVSLVPVVILGLVMGQQVRQSMERRALKTFAGSTQTVAKLMAESYLADAGGVSPTPGSTDTFTPIMAKLTPLSGEKSKLQVVDLFGTIRYSIDRAEIGKPAEPNPDRAKAYRGVVSAHWLKSSDVDGGVKGKRYYRMTVPLEMKSMRMATIEVVAQDEEIILSISNEVRRMQLILAFGLAMLWLSLVPIVWRISRRLARHAEDNEQLALHDALTQLPNRAYLLRRGADAVKQHRTGLLLIDLDNFKDVNDTLGHGAGDRLLVHVAQVLRDLTRDSDVVARLGGDEFAVLLPGIGRDEELQETAARIKRGLEIATPIDGILVSAMSSIGIAASPEHGTTIDQLVQRADIAMYASKDRSSGPVTYSTDIDLHTPSRLALTAELRSALERSEEIGLVFQPIVDAVTGEVVGAEALARWNNPRRGFVSPLDFIGLAERSGLIRPFTERIFTLAAAEVARWRAHGMDFPLSVNLSSRNLSEFDLPERLLAALAKFGLTPGDITIEVTETGLVAETSEELELVHRLRSVGFRLALDDFGTGYSSLTYLQTLHANVLKIDRSFVQQMTENNNDSRIVSAVIDMAHSLDMRVVAEGVETEQQRKVLVQLGCDELQGYLFSRPIPADDLITFVRNSLASSAVPSMTNYPRTD